MNKPKLIEINPRTAKELVQMLDKMQEVACIGCTDSDHEGNCPAKGTVQLRNYLTQRINNPNRKFGI
jgi:hypothetical protein